MDKLCECGCGQPAPLAKQTIARLGIQRGQPRRFIRGHHLRVAEVQTMVQSHREHLRDDGHPNWKGGSYLSSGYVYVRALGHPRANDQGYVFEHVMIAEHALGRTMPTSVEVHHVNQQRHDNRNRNLVICHDHEYHMLLHLRTEAYRATGNPRARKCYICRRWDEEVTVTKHGHGYHRSCEAKRRKELRSQSSGEVSAC